MGPIIKELVTNETLATGTYSATVSAGSGSTDGKYFIKSDGRAMRVFCKHSTSGSPSVTVNVYPVGHFSDAKTRMTWPKNSSGNTDTFLVKDDSEATSSGKLVLMVNGNMTFSEYEVELIVASASSTETYLVVELV